MKQKKSNKNEPTVYESGNRWQKKVYQEMASFLEKKPEIKSFGKSSNGKPYKHLLTVEQSHFNFINESIYTATKERFSKHKAGDLHRILTNTAASQTYCFNLIIYLQQHPALADKLFSILFGKQVSIAHLEPEFTPNLCDNIIGFERAGDESIGDQNLKLGIGTDADIAIFYNYENNKKGVLLIEFKFIEAEFSVCSSFKDKQSIQAICNSANFYSEFVQTKNTLCGYNKYFNWDLTKKSTAVDGGRIISQSSCPFRFGLNQLWRNILLAEQVATARQCDEFGFWVFSPRSNDKYLWKSDTADTTETQFRNVLTDYGNKNFRKIHLESILDELRNITTENDDKNWLSAMEGKYRILLE